MTISKQLVPILEQAKALIFDMDGTLIDSMPLHFEAWLKVTTHYQLPFSEQRFYQLGGVPTYETLQILANEGGKSIDLMEAAHMKESFFESILLQVKPVMPILEIVQCFSGDKPKAIASKK